MMAKLIVQLTSAIRLVAEYPQGLSMLLGTEPPPGCEEIGEMLDCVRYPSEPTLDPAGYPIRVCGGRNFIEADTRIDNAEIFDRVIERAGGWGKINAVTSGWSKLYPKYWRIVIDHAVWMNSCPGRLDGRILKKIADKNRVCECVVSKTWSLFPQRLATAILNTVGEGEEFELVAVEEMKAV
jgi:hypothetical protein